jgi:hypothetical protein
MQAVYKELLTVAEALQTGGLDVLSEGPCRGDGAFSGRRRTVGDAVGLALPHGAAVGAHDCDDDLPPASHALPLGGVGAVGRAPVPPLDATFVGVGVRGVVAADSDGDGDRDGQWVTAIGGSRYVAFGGSALRGATLSPRPASPKADDLRPS